MEKRKTLVLAGIAFVLLVVAVSLVSSYQKKSKLKPAPTPPQALPTEVVIPTLSQEQIEIISKIQTHEIIIKNGALSSTSLTVKRYDQVQWENQDKDTYQIQGEGWGNVPIGPGRRFTQAFEEVGTFPYSCALHPELRGTIIVEE